MPIIKNQIQIGDYDEVRTVEVIPSGMTLTIKATLKNPNYDLETAQDILFTAPSVNEKVVVCLINDHIDPLEIIFGDASPTGNLVMKLCEFTLAPTTTDLDLIDIHAIEVIQ
jgi:hypothetical protein